MFNQEIVKNWADEVFVRIGNKLAITSRKIGVSFPHLSQNGKYDNIGETDIAWWTNGFWPGILWHMFVETSDEYYRDTAQTLEEKMDQAFLDYDGIGHDVGFMWSLSAVANYKITGSQSSRQRGMLAASMLASRFNIDGGFIRAWNGDNVGWAIIDCMMNLPILYWASEQVNDNRFASIAMRHADKAIKEFIRPDGSSNHIVIFDPATGEKLDTPGGQGYERGSSWSRGQSWALYGFMLSYKYTKKQEYLDTAKRVAHYFVSNICCDYVPLTDFRAPAEPVKKDATAGAIAACGLIEIAKAVSEYEADLYMNAAVNILKALDEKCGCWNVDDEALLKMGMLDYHGNYGQVPIIYGDYFFLEAIQKIRGKDLMFW